MIEFMDGYTVDRSGVIISLSYKQTGVAKPMKPSVPSRHSRYSRVCIDGRNVKVHRVVAEAFIPNPYGKSEVNHIDGNRANNRASNLEWVTRSENEQHAWRNGLKVARRGVSNPRARSVRCIDTGIVYGSLVDAAYSTGANRIHIGSVCRGKRNTTGGLRWEYV